MDIRKEVRELLRQTLLAESSASAWRHFERALECLDRSTLVILRPYFCGASCQEIARRLDLTEQEIQDLVRQGKRQLVENLRRRCKVRQ